MAEALTGIAIDPLRGSYEKADGAYEMADGSSYQHIWASRNAAKKAIESIGRGSWGLTVMKNI
jgi:hypothetical protein